MSSASTINGNEKVVRILHRDWVVDNELQINAFALRQNETYISVNRPSIESYVSDVSDFVKNHASFRVSDDSQSIRLASLNVGEVRSISISLGRQTVDLSVEVEPRDSHYQSHAGIFTKLAGQNIKGGQQMDVSINENTTLPIMAIFQKVQYRLKELATLEEQPLGVNSKI